MCLTRLNPSNGHPSALYRHMCVFPAFAGARIILGMYFRYNTLRALYSTSAAPAQIPFSDRRMAAWFKSVRGSRYHSAGARRGISSRDRQ